MRLEHKPKNEKTFKKMSMKVRNYFSDKKALMATGLVAVGIFAAGAVVDATKPKTKTDTVCACTQTKSCKKTVKEGDLISLAYPDGDSRFLEIEGVNKKGIEVMGGVEIPYGKSLKVGEGALTWEIKAEKGKKAGEAVVTVNVVSPCE